MIDHRADRRRTSSATTATALRDTLERAGFDVSATQTRSEIKASIDSLFNAMLLFVSVMALLLGVVGALGLAGTMTMNVVERSREIGVMRAIGARDRAVLLVFLTEGLLIGFLAWLIGVISASRSPRSSPTPWASRSSSGRSRSRPALDGIVFWLLAVAILAVVASFLPAFRATRLAVREVLAYE